MKNSTQVERFNKLLDFLEKRFKTSIDINEIEDISFYSYRNINRIFLALQHETIGQFLKRRKLEKAAEYLKFSDNEISDIALEIGYSDIAAFSKAFKKYFRCTPSRFRNSYTLLQKITNQILEESNKKNESLLKFEIETLPTFQMLYLQYKGTYENVKGIEKTWKQLLKYADKRKLLTDKTIVLGEVLDDDEITESINCRYNAGIILTEAQKIEVEEMFKVKEVASQKYAKFIHKGSHESCFETYNTIYAHWIYEVQLEFADAPTLEFYLNDEENTSQEELITEIYIPVI
ncbi:AraC family transcriptional regulator [Tenacibaculum discolor]|uniref:AraC family transcriptional regulator n=1 Tax=Tenacibaculum discolor TaxID=361581 RepID=UPI000EADDE03|nr:AraC family transcriptional regulator [Tenacibaculum discolor]RLK03044.1 AraC family transcriptional regulator [Tenacibaculum discolor]